MRIGEGYDVHRLVRNRPLILGGEQFEYKKGLLGHSDADVLLHAISDALLGAAALGDVGKHFPPSDMKYKDADSLELLKEVGKLLKNNGFSICNIDATLIAEMPKLSPKRDKIIKNIATALEIDENKVSVKATTEEGLGFSGERLGIAAHAVCLIQKLP